MINRTKRIFVFSLLIFFSLSLVAKDRAKKKQLLNRIYRYSTEMREYLPDSIESNNYTKLSMDFVRRNVSILSIPHVLQLIRNGERQHFLEMYSHAIFYKDNNIKSHRQVYVSTIRKRRETFQVISDYLVPDIYRTTVIDKQLLSPFVKENRRYYIYHNYRVDGGSMRVDFRPKVKNTMLGRGHAIVNDSTGCIVSYEISSEYDMTSYTLRVKMGADSISSLFPQECALDSKISYLGNIIKVRAKVFYNQPTTLPDSITNANNTRLMTSLRPEPLDSQENKIVEVYVDKMRNKYSIPDSIPADSVVEIAGYMNKKKSSLKHIMWDIFGDNLLNHIKGNFGADDKGSFRIGPLLNPGYFGYSGHKGLLYKLKVRASYTFSDNSDISIRAKYGYSFKLSRAYITFPVTYTFNRRKNGYLKFEARTGNRITNSRVLDEVKKEHNKDSIDFDKMLLDYFKNNHYRLYCNYDISEKVGFQAGLNYYYRRAEDRKSFREMGKPIKYNQFAPIVQLQYRPRGYKGPFLLLDYEHGLKDVLGSRSEHDRWEFDAYHTFNLGSLRNWFVRGGFGCYSHKGKDLYFLDYENFRKNDVPEGWDDEWSGEFELLDGNWYNAADYYFRAHATYESPLLLLSWIPIAGQVLEKERIYISALGMRRLSPYVECGYGFTNRVFSMGVFAAFSNKGYEDIGFKFGFELFNKWR